MYGQVFVSLHSLRRLLQLLHHHAYLCRVEQVQTPSEGRKPFVYFLDRKGAEELALWFGCDVKTLGWQKDEREVHHYFLKHLLWINDIRIAITLSASRHNASHMAWSDERTLKKTHKEDVLTLVSQEGGRVQATRLNPDAYFLLKVGEYTYRRFLEVDLGTETVQASSFNARDWSRKIDLYLAYNDQGKFEARYGSRSMVVLNVTTSEKRLGHLKQAVEKKLISMGRVEECARFWFTTFEQLNDPSADILTSLLWDVAGVEGQFGIVAM